MAAPIGNKPDIHDVYVLERIDSIVATQAILEIQEELMDQ